MAIGEEIFPEDCWMAYTDEGELSAMGDMFMKTQRLSEWEGKGCEHPCYECNVDPCETREVEYHDVSKRYIVKPKRF